MGALAVLSGVGTSSALGEVVRLPDGLSSTSQLSSDQKQQIQRFVESQIELLRSGDGNAVEDARRSLQSPFEGSEPSIGFRLEFGRAAAGELKKLATGPDVHRAINAILVAGWCGSSETVDALAPALSDSRPAIRAAAAAALREVVATSAPSRVRKDQGSDAVRRAGSALARESDPVVAITLVAALEAGRGTPLHGEAAAAAGAGVGQLAKAMPSLTAPNGVLGAEAIQRSVSLMFTRLIDPAQSSDMGPDYYKAVISAGASALAYASAHAEEATSDAAAHAVAAMGLVVAAGEQAVLYGEARLADRAAENGSLRDSFEGAMSSGDVDGFRDDVNRIIEGAAKATGKKPSDFGA